MEEQTEKKASRAPLAVLSVVLVVGLLASCGISGAALWALKAQQAQITEMSAAVTQLANANSETVTQEDDVKVGGRYMIRSTLPVSDAYKSGDSSELDAEQKETLELASAVLDEIIEDGMTDYEKEKAVYDWMCAEIGHDGSVTVAVPTTPELVSTPRGVLKYKSSVCVGYATTFRLFMQMLGIDCMVVHNGYHSWDLVKLDGEWYHTDVYTDAGEGRYANFNMNDVLCSQGHDWDTGFFPAATGLKYCYAYQNAGKLEDAADLPVQMRKAVDNGKDATTFYLLDAADEDAIAAAELVLNQLDSVISEYASINDRQMWMWSSKTALSENALLLTVQLDVEDEDTTGQLSEEEQERLHQSIVDAFADVVESLNDPGADWDGEGGEGIGPAYPAEPAAVTEAAG